ncbi:S-adenosyl-L-methionine-dependent methyltransferase [Mycena leptocephala]|nr:S-adenosyl-L-methionine-dependent methyltransferase [Mycena leptocephala]
MDSQKHTDQVYLISAASDSDNEMRRLDALHGALTRYFDGKLSLAAIADVHPQKILDLGCGSGAWAIQAATEFPGALVHAVDISPLPKRKLPVNMSFELADLTKELPFERETFDIVHARFVMGHVPNGESAVKRVAQLVKPGGFFILEDMDAGSVARTGGHATQRFTVKILEVMRSRGADPELARKYGSIMTGIGYFPHVHVHERTVPFSGTGADEVENQLGVAFRKTWKEGSESAGRMIGQGPIEAMMREQAEELEGADCKTVADLHFCWAQRALE